MFVDFSSAFSSLQPHLLLKKRLSDCGLSPPLVRGSLTSCLRTQNAREWLSPPGCVLSPLLFMCTDDNRNCHDRCFVHFLDYIAVKKLSQYQDAHGPLDFIILIASRLFFLHVTVMPTFCLKYSTHFTNRNRYRECSKILLASK